MHKRRSFLALVGIALSGTAARANLTVDRKRCVVIGAGLAGLAAAGELKRLGHDVIVIEARQRLGGRVWTSRQWKDAPLDLGATWIHGIDDNPITDLADKFQAERIKTSYDKSITYATDGRPLSNAQEKTLTQLKRKVTQAIERAQQQDKDQSIRQAIASVQQAYEKSSEELRMLDFIVNSEIEQEYAGSAEEMSAEWFDSSEEFDGADELFTEGFGVIVDHLSRNLDIRLGQIVQRIDWSQSPVKVMTQTEEFVADRVIVTLPLGILKSGRVAFEPPLPAAKQRAVNNLGYGVLNKCYLKFPSAFWPDDVDWLEYIPAKRGYWSEWVSLKRVLNQPILVGFNAAEQGKQIEALSDADIVASAMQTLQKIFGNHIPQPVDHQITRWAADPYSLGSYSFNALGSRPKMRTALAEPLADRLHFAGEATHEEYFGTTHGAYLSGLRCAHEV